MSNALKSALLAASLVVTAFTAPANAQVVYQKKNADYDRATTAMRDGELDQASKLFKRALKGTLREDVRLSAYNNLCAVDFTRGALESAERACSNAIGQNRLYWRAYVNRGHVRAALGKPELALKDLQKAVKLIPDSKLANRVLQRYAGKSGKLFAQAN